MRAAPGRGHADLSRCAYSCWPGCERCRHHMYRGVLARPDGRKGSAIPGSGVRCCAVTRQRRRQCHLELPPDQPWPPGAVAARASPARYRAHSHALLKCPPRMGSRRPARSGSGPRSGTTRTGTKRPPLSWPGFVSTGTRAGSCGGASVTRRHSWTSWSAALCAMSQPPLSQRTIRRGSG